MELEKRNVRTITFCTAPFEKLAMLERTTLGAPDLQLAIMDHPLVNRDATWIIQTVDTLMPLLEQRFKRRKNGLSDDR